MNKFEQLIEYVINDEDQKARELFHDIVVAKSREIYENLMQEEAEEDLDEAEVNEADDSDDDETDDEELDEGAMGGDASDDLIDEIEADEEQDMSMEAEGDDEMGDDEMGDDEGGDFGGDDMGGDDMGGSDEPATKDDVMNLEDKLDELMAEFEGLMGGDDDMGDGDGFGPDEGGDAIEMDDTGEMEPGMMEAISLKAAPKPVTAEQGNGKAGPVAFNSGAAGMASKPVHTGTSMGGVHDSSAYRNTVKELGVTPTQDAGKKAFKSAAPAPVKSQASGVNTKSPLPSGRKG
jgi:hypothetical protein